MSEASVALLFCYSPNAAKKIAVEFVVSLRTAKRWLEGRTFPPARHEELAVRIIWRLNERDRISAELRRQWGKIGETNHAVVGDGGVVGIGHAGADCVVANQTGEVR